MKASAASTTSTSVRSSSSQHARSQRHARSLACEELLSRAATPPDLDHEFARFARGCAVQAASQIGELCDDRGIVAELGETTGAGERMPISARPIGTASLPGPESRGILVSVRIGEIVPQFERILCGSGAVDDSYTAAGSARYSRSLRDRMGKSSAVPGSAGYCSRSEWRRGRTGRALCCRRQAVDGNAYYQQHQDRLQLDYSLRGVSPDQCRTGRTPRRLARDRPFDRGTGDQWFGDRRSGPSAARGAGRRADADRQTGQPAARSVIPVAINRNVPLLIGNLTIAHIGELDDMSSNSITLSFGVIRYGRAC